LEGRDIIVKKYFMLLEQFKSKKFFDLKDKNNIYFPVKEMRIKDVM